MVALGNGDRLITEGIAQQSPLTIWGHTFQPELVDSRFTWRGCYFGWFVARNSWVGLSTL